MKTGSYATEILGTADDSKCEMCQQLEDTARHLNARRPAPGCRTVGPHAHNWVLTPANGQVRERNKTN